MRNKPTFANIRSSASAGSGKTYSLTGRYIAIALEEADPASIVALTFTRKSAGRPNRFLPAISCVSRLSAPPLRQNLSRRQRNFQKRFPATKINILKKTLYLCSTGS